MQIVLLCASEVLMTKRVNPRKQRPERKVEPPLQAHSAGLVAFSESLPVALMRAREAVMARIRPMLREHGLTEQQWRVLRTLGEGEEFEVTQLAKCAFLLPPSLSRILADLAAAGLIVRRTQERDLRRGIVSISDKGRILIDEVAPDAVRTATEVEWLYGGDRMNRLRKLLAELECALSEQTSG